MFLESIATVITAVLTLALIVLFFVIRRMRNKKYHKLLDDGAFVTNYFDIHPELRNAEYVPCKAKPINRLKEACFMGKTFCLIVVGKKVLRIEYSEIYWVFGEVRKKNSKKVSTSGFEAVVFKCLKGTYRLYVRNQSPYIQYLSSLGIPAGYSKKVKEYALEYKKNLITEQKNKKEEK